MSTYKARKLSSRRLQQAGVLVLGLAGLLLAAGLHGNRADASKALLNKALQEEARQADEPASAEQTQQDALGSGYELRDTAAWRKAINAGMADGAAAPPRTPAPAAAGAAPAPTLPAVAVPAPVAAGQQQQQPQLQASTAVAQAMAEQHSGLSNSGVVPRILAVVARFSEDLTWLSLNASAAMPVVVYQAANTDQETGRPIVLPQALVNQSTVAAEWTEVENVAAVVRAHQLNSTNAASSRQGDHNHTDRAAAVLVRSISHLTLHLVPNRGAEAMAYLQAIIDWYDVLPETMLFMHAHHHAWHTHMAQDFILARLAAMPPANLSTGYQTLQCRGDEGFNHFYPLDASHNVHDHTNSPGWQVAEANLWHQAWREHFGQWLGPDMPREVAAAPGASFVVSRAAIQQWPLSFYRQTRDWLQRTSIESKAAGMVMEYMFHLVFGRQALAIVPQEACLCEVYSMCLAQAANASAVAAPATPSPSRATAAPRLLAVVVREAEDVSWLAGAANRTGNSSLTIELYQSAELSQDGQYMIPANISNLPEGTVASYTLPAPPWALGAPSTGGLDTNTTAGQEEEEEAVSVPDISPLPLHVVPAQGREVLAYLTAILRHYDDLPDVMLFTHGSRLGASQRDVDRAWGLEQDWLLRRVAQLLPTNLSAGYASLQCRETIWDWHSRLSPLHASQMVSNYGRGERWQQALAAHWVQAWFEHFAAHLGPEIPNLIQGPALSEFAASRAAIQRWPKEYWAAARQWVLATDMSSDWVSRVWETMWHWLLTGQHEYYQEQTDCFCELYGACSGAGQASLSAAAGVEAST